MPISLGPSTVAEFDCLRATRQDCGTDNCGVFVFDWIIIDFDLCKINVRDITRLQVGWDSNYFHLAFPSSSTSGSIFH